MDLEKLKAEVKYIPLQGDYLLMHKQDLVNFLKSGDDSQSPRADSYQDADSQAGAVAEDKLMLNWKEGKLMGGDKLYYLDECHGVSIINYVDRIEIRFHERVIFEKDRTKTACRITKTHILDVAKLKDDYELLNS